ncbi:hypothetical protein [Bremerella cremea]|uniref:hypothetical protein n=1 Tax=Bremerella cremea TaxID=1031537 RepID=UPI0011C04CC4|nr:hypothetical protein [Bremerella cremea]
MFTILLGTGCSKMSAEEAKIRQAFPSIPAEMPIKNLGEIDFISGSPKKIELDGGQLLAITATAQIDKTIQIILEYQSTKHSLGSVIKQSYTESNQFLLKPGMRCAPKLGDDLAVVFLPKIIESAGETLP